MSLKKLFMAERTEVALLTASQNHSSCKEKDILLQHINWQASFERQMSWNQQESVDEKQSPNLQYLCVLPELTEARTEAAACVRQNI